jgi:hypothetical protein
MVKRHLEDLIPSSLATFPAVLLVGARQVGKSTLVEHLYHKGLIQHMVTLDDLLALESARRDPEGFYPNFPEKSPLMKFNGLLNCFWQSKKSIDQNREPGRFLLTGSANVLS